MARSAPPSASTSKARLGWSETANIYTVVYDNATSGYACAFNSQGDVEIFMQATGEPGWHFIDLYPAIYKGRETRPNNYRLPQLTYADDHPGRGFAAVPLRLRSDAADGPIPGVDQRDEVLHKIERAEDRETAHAAAHAFVRWMEELDVLE